MHSIGVLLYKDLFKQRCGFRHIWLNNSWFSPLSIRRGKRICIINHISEGMFISTMFLQLTLVSVHPSDQSVDLVLPVASITPLHKVSGLLVHATTGRWQLEWPEEVVCGFKVLADCEDLMDEVLNADDAKLACRLKIVISQLCFVRFIFQ